MNIGTDLVDVRRIEKLLTRFGERFTHKVFTKTECDYCALQHNPAAAFAKRFAAKEAALKALGTGLRKGMSWQDIEIQKDRRGKPILWIADELLQKTIGARLQDLDIALSLADEQPYALAFVIILKKTFL